MPYEILESAYAALDEMEQKEVVDFVIVFIVCLFIKNPHKF